MASGNTAVEDNEYTYTYSRGRGKALLFSIQSFELGKKVPDRQFTDADFRVMNTLLHDLGFSIDPYYCSGGKKQLSKAFIKEKLENAAKDEKTNKGIDCFVCVFLSYGFEGWVYASDGWFPVEELMDPFKGDKCPSLINKPKVFILQTCRESIETKHDGPGVTKKALTIPAEADFLTFWSHIPSHGEDGYPHYDEEGVQHGSVFIQILASTLKKMIRGEEDRKNQEQQQAKAKEDFLHLCVRVTGEVKKYLEEHHEKKFQNDNDKRILPLTINVLTKDLYLL